jgi:hypothetical protein
MTAPAGMKRDGSGCNALRSVLGVSIVLAALGPSLAGCDQSGSGGHMMGGGMMSGGMMGGGMMGQPSSGNGGQTLPAPQAEGARLLRRYCGRCHAPPAPAAHAAREWPQVVARMKQHMLTQGKALPSREQFQEITAYLQRYAE